MTLARFDWHGVDNNGFRSHGEHRAMSASEVEAWLQTQHITPLHIVQKKNWQWLHQKKIKFTDITDFSRELLTLITAGIPLATALHIMQESSAIAPMRVLIYQLKKQVEEGHLLNEALAKHKKYFNAIFLHFIAAGEQMGRLEQVLRHIIDHREKMTTLKRTLKKALYYPTMVLVVAVAVTSGLLLFVIPQFEALFSGMGASLPSMTRAVIYIAQQLRSVGFIGFIAMLVSVVSLYFLFRKVQRLNVYWQNFLLRLPFIGPVLKEIIIARCFYTLAMILQAGLPLLDGLHIVAHIAHHIRYTTAFSTVSKQIQAGQTLHDALEHTKLFPGRILQMVAIGEEAGRLDAMLLKLSEYYAERVNTKVNTFSQLLEPSLMIFLSIIVGGLVIAMYLPIFRLGSVL